VQLVYGLRVSNIAVIGPGKFYTYDNKGRIIATKTYAKGKRVASYWNWEPRFSASYQFNTATSLKLSYNRNVQNLHLLTNATSSQPTDLWLPSTNNIKPEIADQVALGFYKNVANDQYEFSAETYYKTMENQIDYRNAAEVFGNDNIESELLYGSGRAYGIELLLKKKTGRLTGWLGYTLSRVEKKFTEINNNTGNAVTFPSGKYQANGQTVFLYTERNGYRMPAYHRLDFAATLEAKKNNRRRLQSSWTFGLYNVYGRANAFTITFRDSKTDPTKTEAVRTALFRYIPSVTWNFKF
jgi:TonB dependent receptor